MPFISDPQSAIDKITSWIRGYLHKANRTQLVLGLSGGIDSALAAYLAVEAVGADNLHCVMMPYKTSSPESLDDAHDVILALKVPHRTIEITPMVDAFMDSIGDMDNLRRGNIAARVRMTTLFDQSHANGLVLGTSNKTEVLLGYGTLFGDGAWSLNPLGDLYKTDVRLLSKHLGVPEPILEKPPTADLWPGQTDEADLGHLYEEMDKVLLLMVDEKKSRLEIVNSGYSPELVERVVSLVRVFHFKRKPMPTCWLDKPFSTAHLEDLSW